MAETGDATVGGRWRCARVAHSLKASLRVAKDGHRRGIDAVGGPGGLARQKMVYIQARLDGQVAIRLVNQLGLFRQSSACRWLGFCDWKCWSSVFGSLEYIDAHTL